MPFLENKQKIRTNKQFLLSFTKRTIKKTYGNNSKTDHSVNCKTDNDLTKEELPSENMKPPIDNLQKSWVEKILIETSKIEWPSLQNALETTLLVIAVIIVSSTLLSGINLLLDQ